MDPVGSREAAFEVCRRIAREHYENFPVASLWLPADWRPDVAAVYAFARIADDFADEPGMDAAERLGALADWRRRLVQAGTGHENHPVFWALGDVIARRGLPLDPFHRLLTAFEMDVTRTRHDTFADLRRYCRHSADPVGEIVLRVAGAWTEERGRRSDAVCTALQLANFWQDVTVDAAKDRLYLPLEDLAARGLSPEEALRGPATPALRELILFEVRRTRSLFDEGRPLVDDPPAGLARELRFVWLGGNEILNRIEAQGGDVWSRRPKLGRGDWLKLAPRGLFWRRARAAAA